MMKSCKALLLSATLGIAAIHAARAQSLLPITFSPASPTANQAVTAILPFEICSWTIVTSGTRIDIDWIAAPCADELFTNQIDLGALAPGTHAVYLDFAGGATPVEQALGTLVVASAAVAPLKTLQPFGLLACCLGLALLGIRALRDLARRDTGRRPPLLLAALRLAFAQLSLRSQRGRDFFNAGLTRSRSVCTCSGVRS